MSCNRAFRFKGIIHMCCSELVLIFPSPSLHPRHLHKSSKTMLLIHLFFIPLSLRSRSFNCATSPTRAISSSACTSSNPPDSCVPGF
eukprot:2220097-Amphidinium_carterae.3